MSNGVHIFVSELINLVLIYHTPENGIRKTLQFGGLLCTRTKIFYVRESPRQDGDTDGYAEALNS